MTSRSLKLPMNAGVRAEKFPNRKPIGPSAQRQSLFRGIGPAALENRPVERDREDHPDDPARRRDTDGDRHEVAVTSAEHGREEGDEDGGGAQPSGRVHDADQAREDRERREEVGDELRGRGAGRDLRAERAQRALLPLAASTGSRVRRRSGLPCGPGWRPGTGARGPRRRGGSIPPPPRPSPELPAAAAGGSFTDHQIT